MNIGVDRPSILLHPMLRDEMLLQPLLVVHIQERDWTSLQNSEQIALRGYKTTGRIVIVPTKSSNLEMLYDLATRYPGFSIAGLMVVQYCLSHGYPIYSVDVNLLKVAGESGVVRYELREELYRKAIREINEMMKVKLKP